MFFEKLKNFFLHGSLLSDEEYYIGVDSNKGRFINSYKEKEPINVSDEERKAIMKAAFEFFTPIFLILAIIVVLLLVITIKYF